MNKWKMLRIVLIALTIVIAFMDGLYKDTESLDLNFKTILFAFFFCILALPFLMKIQCKAPYVDQKWVMPSFETNFLKIGDPLHFFHIVSFLMLFGGFSALLASSMFNNNIPMNNLIPIAIGFGLWIGVKITIWICNEKYSTGPDT